MNVVYNTGTVSYLSEAEESVEAYIYEPKRLAGALVCLLAGAAFCLVMIPGTRDREPPPASAGFRAFPESSEVGIQWTKKRQNSSSLMQTLPSGSSFVCGPSSPAWAWARQKSTSPLSVGGLDRLLRAVLCPLPPPCSPAATEGPTSPGRPTLRTPSVVHAVWSFVPEIVRWYGKMVAVLRGSPFPIYERELYRAASMVLLALASSLFFTKFELRSWKDKAIRRQVRSHRRVPRRP